jgi:hypothetical protein
VLLRDNWRICPIDALLRDEYLFGPIECKLFVLFVVGATGLEPVTSCV